MMRLLVALSHGGVGVVGHLSAWESWCQSRKRCHRSKQSIIEGSPASLLETTKCPLLDSVIDVYMDSQTDFLLLNQAKLYTACFALQGSQSFVVGPLTWFVEKPARQNGLSFRTMLMFWWHTDLHLVMVTLSKMEGVLDVSTYYTLYSKESDQNIMSLYTFMKVRVRMKMWYTHSLSTKLARL